MKEIKTLVYFDLEATGLKSSGNPRITEISLLAVNIQDILDLHERIKAYQEKTKIEENVPNLETILPSVINKLTLCVYPMATIVPLVSNITGLDNYNLSGQARFDKNTAELLNNFLNRLPSPVCLVAHNGDFYDFPLLKAEMEKIGAIFSSQIMCVDSYVGIKEIFKKRDEDIMAEEARRKEEDKTEETKIIEQEIEAAAALLNAGEFEAEMKVGKSNEVRDVEENDHSRTTKIISHDVYQVPRKRNCKDIIDSSEVFKHENELTPVSNITTMSRVSNPRKMRQSSCSLIFKSKKKLNFSIPSTPTSFSLLNLHKHLLGCLPAQSHGAEADCLALLRTTAVLGKEWLDWLNNNSYLFTDCKVMWRLASQRKCGIEHICVK
jgi:DNA polymerase III epsilon subunit-like protein